MNGRYKIGGMYVDVPSGKKVSNKVPEP